METKKSMRYYQMLGLLGLVIVAGGLGAWASLTSIQGAIIAQGVTTVESSSKKIQHREGGIVKTINIKEGQRVREGDVLIELDETEIKSQLAIFEGLLLEQMAQSARLKALRDGAEKINFPAELIERKSEKAVEEIISGQIKLFMALKATSVGRRNQLEERVAQLDKQIIGQQSQLVARRDQFKLISDELTSLEGLLKKGLVPVSRVLALKRERSNLGGQEGELISNIAQTRSRISETKLQIIQLEDEDRGKVLGELRQVETELTQNRERRIATAAKLRRTSILAPRAGYVLQLAVHTIGGVVGPGEVIMLIVPELDDIIVEARVNPQDIDQIFLNQNARVLFSAFNMRTTPEISATVTHVGADLTQQDAQTPPYYAIKLKMTKEDLTKLGDNKLIPGMPAETFIQTRNRTPMSYLIQPLRDQIMRAFREE